MDELLKDLEAIDKEQCEQCKDRLRCAEISCAGLSRKELAARLTELGWVKPIRCGKCARKRHCTQRVDFEHEYTRGVSLDYCSEGEPREGKE